MRELFDLQSNFQNYLLDKSTSIINAVVDREPVSATARLNVYRESYYLRLIEALALDYEVIRALVGEEEFDQIAFEYIQEHPSSFRSIRWYGEKFSDFLKKKTDQECLIEMAQFEWLLTEAFDAADSTVITLENMAAIPPKKWPKIRFKLHPSLRSLTLTTNAVAIWQSYTEQNIALTPEQTSSPVTWIIWRKELDVHFRSLTQAEAFMLQALATHQSFKTLCEGLSTWLEPENIALEAALFLKRLITDQLIIDITY